MVLLSLFTALSLLPKFGIPPIDMPSWPGLLKKGAIIKLSMVFSVCEVIWGLGSTFGESRAI